MESFGADHEREYSAKRKAEVREQMIEYIARLIDQYAAEKRAQAGNRTKPGQTYDMARATAAEEIAAIVRAAK